MGIISFEHYFPLIVLQLIYGCNFMKLMKNSINVAEKKAWKTMFNYFVVPFIAKGLTSCTVKVSRIQSKKDLEWIFDNIFMSVCIISFMNPRKLYWNIFLIPWSIDSLLNILRKKRYYYKKIHSHCYIKN